MIYLTFKHSRDIFKKNEFQTWVKRWLPSARFTGCEYGNHYPTISVKTVEFIEWKKHVMECYKEKAKVVKVEGVFNVIEQLSLGVRDFSNDLRIKSDFNKNKNKLRTK